MICESLGWDYRHADRLDHAVGGALIGAVAAVVIDEVRPRMHPAKKAALALAPVVLIAVAKEVADHQAPSRHSSDWRDAAATVAGGSLAVGITISLRW